MLRKVWKNIFSLETDFSIALFFFFFYTGELNSRDISNENGSMKPRQTTQCPSNYTSATWVIYPFLHTASFLSCFMANFLVSCYLCLYFLFQFEVLIFSLRESQDTRNIPFIPLLPVFLFMFLFVISKNKL